MKYAKTTDVSTEKSRGEIERTLIRYGAHGFAYGWQENQSIIAFKMNNRQIKFLLPMPDRNSREITHTAVRGSERSEQEKENAFEQACRQKWRALSLCIKAKLEAVECGITTFEDEFLAQLVLPNGNTVGRWMQPQIAQVYENNKMPPLLGFGG